MIFLFNYRLWCLHVFNGWCLTLFWHYSLHAIAERHVSMLQVNVLPVVDFRPQFHVQSLSLALLSLQGWYSRDDTMQPSSACVCRWMSCSGGAVGGWREVKASWGSLGEVFSMTKLISKHLVSQMCHLLLSFPLFTLVLLLLLLLSPEHRRRFFLGLQCLSVAWRALCCVLHLAGQHVVWVLALCFWIRPALMNTAATVWDLVGHRWLRKTSCCGAKHSPRWFFDSQVLISYSSAETVSTLLRWRSSCTARPHTTTCPPHALGGAFTMRTALVAEFWSHIWGATFGRAMCAHSMMLRFVLPSWPVTCVRRGITEIAEHEVDAYNSTT